MSNIKALIIGRLIVAFVCAMASFGLAVRGLDGWGWFLFASLCLGCVTVKAEKMESIV